MQLKPVEQHSALRSQCKVKPQRERERERERERDTHTHTQRETERETLSLTHTHLRRRLIFLNIVKDCRDDTAHEDRLENLNKRKKCSLK